MNSRFFTTGIGSLPIKDAESAVKYVFERYSLPFFPQLVPMLDEVEPKGMTPDQVVARQAATAPFLERLGGIDPVKLQIAGPVTLQRAADDGVDRWDWVELMTLAWIRRVREVTEGPVHFLWDDALLAAEASPEDVTRLKAFAARLRKNRVALGLHCCSPLPLAELTRVAPGMTLAVDAHVVDLVSPAAVAIARAHAGSGGRFLLGIVDTRQETVDPAAAPRLLAGILDAWRGFPQEALVAVSGGCGTALHSEAYEREVSAVLTRCVTSTDWQAVPGFA